MGDTIDFAVLVRLLRRAAAIVRAHEAELSRLDSFGGDGDHGTTMVRAMGQLEGALDAAAGDAQTTLHEVGWAIMGVDGGATGPLFGSLCMAMSGAAPAEGEIDAPTLANMFDAGLAGVQKNTRAAVGDKTMIDALLPGVRAFAQAARSGGDIAAAFAAAATAARQGAEDTTDMAARFGRAKNVGDKSKGAPDPGATSVALLFQGMHEGLRDDG
ncbi:MAG: dihydroxyacetone kinase subunit L [Sphingomonas sp.]|uniref:dihydroxyacetone kinase subunit DhaL n=1 Tax=Sphingomonas sp. TaxID=28214 RepID=UPI00258B5B92|nr:dihydroxyacetone kinase subunit DhaL [Sphingomonas sp.]MCP4028442.1 dihydroxyacetone kinase subunit L [Sphingomonas sp.]